jgi:hypothetical protein
MDWRREIIIFDDDFEIIKTFAFIAMAIGLLTKLVPLAVVGCFFLLFIYANHYYLNKVGERLIVENVKRTVKLFPKDKDRMLLKLSLFHFLPILHAKMIITIDNIVHSDLAISRHVSVRQVREIAVPFSILGKQTAEISIPYEAMCRGTTKIKSLQIVIPHLFGFGEVRLFYKKTALQEILIYPLPMVVTDMEKVIPRNQGDFTYRNSYFDDLITVIGTREYTEHDPFNKINWKATARTNSLQTKVYDKITQYSWTILLDVNQEHFEEVVSGITYFLEHLTRRNISFELCVNIGTMGRKPYVHLPIGNGADHLQKALELLARLTKNSLVSFHFDRMMTMINRNEQLSPFVMICSDLENLGGSLLHGSDYYSLLYTDKGLKLQKKNVAWKRMGGGK